MYAVHLYVGLLILVNREVSDSTSIKEQRMTRLFKAVAVVVVAIGSVSAQDAPMISQHLKPGDPLHYFVQFNGNPELNGLRMLFRLQEGMRKDQAGFGTIVILEQFKPGSPGVFEVNGVIPKDAASGTYQLEQVLAMHAPAARVYNPSEFQKVTVNVVNDAGYDFPPLKSIRPNPPH
jgi:hypothetical protein